VTGTASAPYGTATSRLDFLAGSYPGSGINDLFSLPHLQGNGPGSYSYVLPTTLNTPIDLFYWSSAYIEVLDTQTVSHVGQSFNAFANFSSTYTLESIDLRDSNGDLIPTWTMEDTSVPGVALFNQSGRTAAAGAGSSAPEPTTLLFLALGGTLTLARRRRN
jgi:PEP-CTERM motif